MKVATLEVITHREPSAAESPLRGSVQVARGDG